MYFNNSNEQCSFRDTDITKFKIYQNNGNSMMLIPLMNTTTITVGIFINVGSCDEKNKFGIAHFIEHMTFKGTVKLTANAVMKQLDSMGAVYNAMTAHEFTLYYISGDPKDVFSIIDIIIDLFNEPSFLEEEINKERNVILDELNMDEDNSYHKLAMVLYNNVYKHKYQGLARPIIGFPETIKTIKREDIIKFREYNYKNCVLVVSGNFIQDTVHSYIEKKVNKIFNEVTMYNPLIVKEVYVDNINMYDKVIYIDKQINQSIIYLMFGTYDQYNLNKYVADMICDILSNGFSSRLFDLLRGKLGIAYNNNTVNRTFRNTGNMIISLSVDNDNTILAISALLQELKNIVQNGFTKEEIKIAKKQNKTALLFQFKDPYEYMFHYGLCYLNKLPMLSISETLNLFDAITDDNINLVAKNIFVKNNMIIGIVGRKDHTKEINDIVDKF